MIFWQEGPTIDKNQPIERILSIVQIRKNRALTDEEMKRMCDAANERIRMGIGIRLPGSEGGCLGTSLRESEGASMQNSRQETDAASRPIPDSSDLNSEQNSIPALFRTGRTWEVIDLTREVEAIDLTNSISKRSRHRVRDRSRRTNETEQQHNREGPRLSFAQLLEALREENRKSRYEMIRRDGRVPLDLGIEAE